MGLPFNSIERCVKGCIFLVQYSSHTSFTFLLGFALGRRSPTPQIFHDSWLQGREGSRSCYNGNSVSSKTLGTSWSHGRKLSFSILHRHLDWQCCHKSSIYDELDRHSWRSSCSRTTVISHIRSQ